MPQIVKQTGWAKPNQLPAFQNIYFLIFSNIFYIYSIIFYISKYFLLNNIIHLEDDVAEPALLALEPELLEDGDAVVGL